MKHLRSRDKILIAFVVVVLVALVLYMTGWNRVARGQGADRSYLPVVLADLPAQPTAGPFVLDVPIPDGIRPHFTNSPVKRDANGTLFAATRSGVHGGMVWKVEPGGQPEPVLVLDLARSYGNGSLEVWEATDTSPEVLVYVAIPCLSSSGEPPCPSPDHYVVYEVPGWDP